MTRIMSELSKWQIWLNFDLKLQTKVEKVKIRQRIWGWSSWKTRTITVDRVITDKWDVETLDNAVFEIAYRAGEHMYNYAPFDESPYRDDIVLRDNITVRQIWYWNYMVWPNEKIPYALRRNFENKLHKNKRHYIEKSWNFHIDEYEEILKKKAEWIAQEELIKIIKWMGNWWSWTNWLIEYKFSFKDELS